MKKRSLFYNIFIPDLAYILKFKLTNPNPTVH